jgi:hypothetical protein
VVQHSFTTVYKFVIVVAVIYDLLIVKVYVDWEGDTLNKFNDYNVKLPEDEGEVDSVTQVCELS